MKNKILLENGTGYELTQAELSIIIKSVQLMSEDGLTSEQKLALEHLRKVFETVDF
jgi:DNA-directed RNA polymerase subunit F